MLKKIKSIELSLNSNNVLSALALSLTIPDICGQVEYGDEMEGGRNSRKRYERWFNEFVERYYADESGGIEDYKLAESTYFTGEMCYQLRCSFLHDGNSDITKNGKIERNFIFELNLFVGDSISRVEFKNSRDEVISKTKTIKINVKKLCESLCEAARECYEKYGADKFKDHNIIFVDEWYVNTYHKELL